MNRVRKMQNTRKIKRTSLGQSGKKKNAAKKKPKRKVEKILNQVCECAWVYVRLSAFVCVSGRARVSVCVCFHILSIYLSLFTQPANTQDAVEQPIAIAFQDGSGDDVREELVFEN